ncbi:MAG: hypothetical protein WBX22_19040 [Silvibacterium sp.]|jgi:hypothetical protein
MAVLKNQLVCNSATPQHLVVMIVVVGMMVIVMVMMVIVAMTVMVLRVYCHDDLGLSHNRYNAATEEKK